MSVIETLCLTPSPSQRSTATRGRFLAVVALVGALFGPTIASNGQTHGANVEPAIAPAAAAQHRIIRWSGKLARSATAGFVTAADQAVELQLTVYSEPAGGVALWTETQTVSIGTDGRYTVMLGAASPDGVPATLFPSGEARYIEVISASTEAQANEPLASPIRSLIAAVPYAYKAVDADSLAGHGASDYLTREDFQQSLQEAFEGKALPSLTQTTSALTGAGTANTLALWTTSSNLSNSIVTQSGTNVGIGTTTPASTLDVNGNAEVRGSLILPANGVASSGTGYSSHSVEFTATSYSSTSAESVAQNFKFQAYPSSNNTSAPSASLELLFGLNNVSPVATGLAFAPNGRITFAPGQTFPGTGQGTITGVSAGTDLLGGGVSGNVTLSLDTTKVPGLAAANTFIGKQSIASGNLALPATASSTNGVLTLGGIPFLHGYAAGKSNVFVGGAGNFTTTGSAETGVGSGALVADSIGSNNSAVGAGALANNKIGSGNTALGYRSGPDSLSPSLANTTAIGSGANVSQSNSLVLGQNSVGNPGKAFVNVGIGTATPQSILEASVLAPGSLGPVITLSNHTGTVSAPGIAGSAAAINFLTRPGSSPSSQIMAVNDGGNGDDISFMAITDVGPQSIMVVSANNGVQIEGSGLDVSGAGSYQDYTNGLNAISGAGGSFIPYPGGGDNGQFSPFVGGDGGDFTGGTSVTAPGGAGGRFFGGLSGTGDELEATGGDGIYAETGAAFSSCVLPNCQTQLNAGRAATLVGDVSVSGTLTASTKDFKIDHPDDPANKYLLHASVESSELMNIYSGNVVTDELGLATIELPSWFETLNADFRYQLTVIGQFAQAIVKEKIAGHKFSIMTNQTHVEVSWQVTAVRHDPYARAHPLVVEQNKPANERGFFQNPELYGLSKEKQTEWGRSPLQMARMKIKREAAASALLNSHTRLLRGARPNALSPVVPKQAAATSER